MEILEDTGATLVPPMKTESVPAWRQDLQDGCDTKYGPQRTVAREVVAIGNTTFNLSNENAQLREGELVAIVQTRGDFAAELVTSCNIGGNPMTLNQDATPGTPINGYLFGVRSFVGFYIDKDCKGITVAGSGTAGAAESEVHLIVFTKEAVNRAFSSMGG